MCGNQHFDSAFNPLQFCQFRRRNPPFLVSHHHGWLLKLVFKALLQLVPTPEQLATFGSMSYVKESTQMVMFVPRSSSRGKKADVVDIAPEMTRPLVHSESQIPTNELVASNHHFVDSLGQSRFFYIHEIYFLIVLHCVY